MAGRLGSIAAKRDGVLTPRARCVRMESSLRGAIARQKTGVFRRPMARNDDRGSTQMQLALGPSFADKAIHHPSDACRHARICFGAFFLVFARDPTRQRRPSTVDAHLHPVAWNGEIPMQRRHDCELNALVASPLPIVLVVCSKLELRGDVGWVANRNDGLACSFVRIFPRNALQFYLLYLSDSGCFPLLTTQRLILGSVEAAFEIGSQACAKGTRGPSGSLWSAGISGP